jgi:hypothetical protein
MAAPYPNVSVAGTRVVEIGPGGDLGEEGTRVVGEGTEIKVVDSRSEILNKMLVESSWGN